MFDSSWPGLSRPSTFLKNRIVQIIPFRIVLQDQSDFPFSRPVLQIAFTLDRGSNVVIALEINQALDRILLCESRDEAVSMFVDASHEIVRHSDVKDTVR